MKLKRFASPLLSLLILGLTLRGAQAGEIKVGDKVPSFRVLGTDGKMHNLREAIGKSWLVVAWYPKAATRG